MSTSLHDGGIKMHLTFGWKLFTESEYSMPI